MLDRDATKTIVLFLGSIWLLPACPRDDGPPPRLMAVATEQEALQLVGHFFDAYVHVDIDTTSRLLCEQDPESLGRVRAFVQHSQARGSPYRVEQYQVRSAVPMWIGKEPYFRVEVSFPRKSGRGEILHQYRVRVRDGCLEGFLEPGPGPRPAPPPVGSGVDVDDDEVDPLRMPDSEPLMIPDLGPSSREPGAATPPTPPAPRDLEDEGGETIISL